MKSILSDIVGKYSRHTENICSESLALIINQSGLLQSAFADFINKKSGNKITLGNTYNIQTQVSSDLDSALPDLEIQTQLNQTVLVEAKFWAGLTPHQPNSYLKRILQNDSGALLFIAPERRLFSLQKETANRAEQEFNVQSFEFGFVVKDTIPVTFISWTDTLTALWNSALYANETESLHNLFQLKTLVRKLDSEGFIPFDSLLFTPAAAKQRDQLVDLLDDIVSKSKGKLNKDRLTYGGGKYAIKNFFRLNGKLEGFLLYSSDFWMKYQETPIYFCLSIKPWGSKDKTAIPRLKDIQGALNAKEVAFVVEEEIYSDYPCLAIPLFPLMGVDKETVLDNLLIQTDGIIGILEEFTN